MTEEYVKKINDIIDNFDFEKVHAYMTLIKWVWFCEGIPSVSELKETAKKLLIEAIEKEYAEIATGGFFVINDSKIGYLWLGFCIEDGESY